MKSWKVAGLTILACAATGAALGGAMVVFGWYDVSATGSHTVVVHEVLDVAQTRSVKRRAAGIQVPDLDEPRKAREGYGLFQKHCVQCHGAPGIAPEPYALGLNPAPAALVATARDRTAADIYWIIQQGIKMTGMPAWQYRLTDADIWNIVAFMRVLPTLSPADYRNWDKGNEQEPGLEAATPVPATRAGDPVAGRAALQQHLCATCHVIPGIAGARHHVGPSLAGIAQRPYIAGGVPNTPASMERWLRDPAAFKPGTAMPDLGLGAQEARDIAAFLYTLPPVD